MINKIFLIVAFTFVSLLSFSQDVIVKKNGSTIDAKVVEITSELIKYKKFSQLDGPLRNIELINVKEIRYADGEVESFESETVQFEEEIVILVPEPESVAEIIFGEPKDPLFSSGFFFNIVVGYGGNTRYDYNYYYDPFYSPTSYNIEKRNTDNVTFNFVIGNKWYFGSSEKWRPGLQVNWGRIGINVEPEYPESIILGPKNISPVNVGMCNIFKFSESIGLEANFTTGFNLELDPDYGRVTPGLMISPEVRFRYKKLAVGIDYSRIQTFGLDEDISNWNIAGLTFGLKF